MACIAALVFVCSCSSNSLTPAPQNGAAQPIGASPDLRMRASGIHIREIPSPQALYDITVASDGSPWFTGNGIGTFRANSFTFYPAPSPYDNFDMLARAPRGVYGVVTVNESQSLKASNVLSLTNSGGMTQLSSAFAFGPGYPNAPVWIKDDPATGLVWWVVFDSGRLTSTILGGTFQNVRVTSKLPFENDAGPFAVARNGLYVFDYANPMKADIAGGTYVVLKVSKTNGSVLASYPSGAIKQVNDMAADSKGNIWLTDPQGNAVWKMTSSGTFAKYALSTPNATPYSIVLGGDGAMWFTERYAGRIGRISANGTITEYRLSAGMQPIDIAAPDYPGCDSSVLWFTEDNGSNGAAALGEITGLSVRR